MGLASCIFTFNERHNLCGALSMALLKHPTHLGNVITTFRTWVKKKDRMNAKIWTYAKEYSYGKQVRKQRDGVEGRRRGGKREEIHLPAASIRARSSSDESLRNAANSSRAPCSASSAYRTSASSRLRTTRQTSAHSTRLARRRDSIEESSVMRASSDGEGIGAVALGSSI